VLILAEEPVQDGAVPKPIIEAMMKAIGKPQARVEVCKDPRFRGTSQALKWEFIRQAISRHQGSAKPPDGSLYPSGGRSEVSCGRCDDGVSRALPWGWPAVQ
jgi:hypothetical protein